MKCKQCSKEHFIFIRENLALLSSSIHVRCCENLEHKTHHHSKALITGLDLRWVPFMNHIQSFYPHVLSSWFVFSLAAVII